MSLISQPRIEKVAGDPSKGYSYLVAGFNVQGYEYDLSGATPSDLYKAVYMNVQGYSQFGGRFYPINNVSFLDVKHIFAAIFERFETGFPDGVNLVFDEQNIFKGLIIRFGYTHFVPGFGYNIPSLAPQPTLYGTMAVMQAGERVNMLDYLIWREDEVMPSADKHKKFLTEFDNLIKWKTKDTQLPSEFSCVIDDYGAFSPHRYYILQGTDYTLLHQCGVPATETYYLKRIDTHFLDDGEMYIQWWEDNNPLGERRRATETKRIETRQVDYNPYHVRWLNRLGGIDCWCFSKRQKRAYAVGDVVTSQRFVSNNESTEARNIVVNKSGTYGVTAGAANLTERDWQALSWIIYSPFVEYYDIDTNTWIPVTVDSKGSQYTTDRAVGTFECTFVHDELNLQY